MWQTYSVAYNARPIDETMVCNPLLRFMRTSRGNANGKNEMECDKSGLVRVGSEGEAMTFSKEALEAAEKCAIATFELHNTNDRINAFKPIIQEAIETALKSEKRAREIICQPK